MPEPIPISDAEKKLQAAAVGLSDLLNRLELDLLSPERTGAILAFVTLEVAATTNSFEEFESRLKDVARTLLTYGRANRPAYERAIERAKLAKKEGT